MSKIVAGTAFVLLAGATVTGGVLLSKSKTSDQAQEQHSPEEPLYYDLPATFEAFKTSNPQKGCLRKLFSDVSQLGDSANDMGTDDFNTTSPSTFFPKDQQTKGCLIVNWDKKTKSVSGNNKWGGSFRLLWAVKGENKGFIAFLSGKPTKDNATQKISWEGMGYLMTAAGTGNEETKTWSVSKKSKVKDGASFPSNESDEKKFPQAGNILKKKDGSAAIGNFWGWINGAGDVANIGTDDELTDPTSISSLRACWEWSGSEPTNPSTDQSSSQNKLIDWSQEPDKWLDVVFDKTKFKAKEASENQKGAWTQRQYEETPATTAA